MMKTNELIGLVAVLLTINLFVVIMIPNVWLLIVLYGFNIVMLLSTLYNTDSTHKSFLESYIKGRLTSNKIVLFEVLLAMFITLPYLFITYLIYRLFTLIKSCINKEISDCK